MSRTTVIVALVLAVVLAGLALILVARDGPVVVRGPVLGIDQARVREVRVERESGRFEAVRRGRSPGEWEVVLGGPGGEKTWPAEASRVRAMLRILATLEFARGAASGDEVGEGAAVVRVVSEDGERVMRLSERALAGQVLVEVSDGEHRSPETAIGGTGWIGADVRDMLVAGGPREWRDPSALSVGPETARITLRGAAGSVSLGRVQGRWAVREPIQEMAEPEAVAKLSGALGSVLISDFLDSGVPERTGLEAPAAELVVEADVRDAGGGAARVVRQVVRVGAGSDLTGKGVYAALERDGVSRTVVVGSGALAGINSDPAAYVARRAVSGAGADVGKMVVTPTGGAGRVFQRTLEGWTVGGASASREDVAGIGAVLKLLMEERAEAVAIAEDWPAPWAHEALERMAGTVELESAGGTPMGAVKIAVVKLDGKTGRVAVQGRKVWRVYGAGVGGELVEWIAGR